MNIFRLTVIKFCIVFFIPLKVYSQSTEIYTDLRGNKYAAINDKGMVKYKVEDRSKNTNFRSYIQLYKYDSNDNPQEEKDENGNYYRTLSLNNVAPPGMELGVSPIQNDTAYREAKRRRM